METELATWLRRYPVPIIVSAFTDSGDLLHVSAVRACDHLIGWLDSATTAPCVHWRIVPLAELPPLISRRLLFDGCISDVPFRTGGSTQASKPNSAPYEPSTILVAHRARRGASRPGCSLSSTHPSGFRGSCCSMAFRRSYIQALKLSGLWPKPHLKWRRPMKSGACGTITTTASAIRRASDDSLARASRGNRGSRLIERPRASRAKLRSAGYDGLTREWSRRALQS